MWRMEMNGLGGGHPRNVRDQLYPPIPAVPTMALASASFFSFTISAASLPKAIRREQEPRVARGVGRQLARR